jgi:hypothetical protein
MTEKAISPLRRRLIEDIAAPGLSTTISVTSKGLPISWASLPTRPPQRMSIAIRCGWRRSERRYLRERGRELIGDHRPYCDCPRHLIETTARPSPRSRDTGAAP